MAAGTRGPATGNVVTGTGTQTGSLGVDLAVNDAQITSIAGAGGSDTALSGGRFEVAGEFGQLSIDPQGNYRYLANQGAPENSRDHFTYKLADAQGDSDNAILTIEIGKSQSLGESQMVVPGPDGMVLLPAGVELSDVRVVGRNLVIDLPDGTQMVIVDGAVFVPQLVIDNVQVPATNLAALLIDSEPTPAAGGQPPSGGGNFAVPVGPLDPGVPLGDLIPPTALDYTPPEFKEINEFRDKDVEVVIGTPDQPAGVVNATASVNEAGLPARLAGEPEGSGEEAAAGTNGDTSEITTGIIDIDAPDGLDGVSINGTLVSGAIGQSFAGAFGTLTITSIVGTEIGYSYTLNDNTSGNGSEDVFSVVVTDDDGDSAAATLTIDIVDDAPTARADTDSIAAGQFGPATGNVITDAAAGDLEDGDTNARDTVGADDASITSVSGFGGSDSAFNEAGGLVVNGQYGVLTVSADGDYSYVRNAGTSGGVTDVFNYTLTDGDGDTSTSTLTIGIGNATPDAGQNPTILLDDDALTNGNPGGVGDDPNAANLAGTLSGAGGDGALTFDLQANGAPAGFTYVDGPNGSILVQQGGTTVLTVTLNAETGAYTVTQNAPIDHAAGGNENNVDFTIGYTVTDIDGGSASGSLAINVDDDTPTIGRTDRALPTLTVDETDLALNASGDFSALFDGRIGADLPGSVAFSLSVVNGSDSGTVDVATGQNILLFNNAGVIEARVGGADGPVAYVISVDSATGVVSVDQVRALSHPDETNPDDSVSPTSTAIQLTATVTDGDGDSANLSVNIGGQIAFEDDGPRIISESAVGSSVVLDETDGASPLSSGAPISATSATAITVAGVDFGADGPGSTVYGLSLLGNTAVGSSIASGLATAAGDLPITLTLTSSTLITGSYEGGTAFTIQMNDNGTVTVTQFTALEHLIDGSSPAAHDDPLSLVNGQLQSLVNATVAYEDADGDAVSAAVGIGGAIVFEDDGPSIDVILTVPTEAEALAALNLTTGDNGTEGPGQTVQTSTSGFAAMFTLDLDGGADGAASTPDIDYSLGLLVGAGTATGLESNGQAINLYLVGGVVVGATSAPATATSPSVVFSLSIGSEGAVTLTQFQQIDHAPESPSGSPFADQLVALGAGFVEIIASSTIVDQDGDTATDSERFD
ncbi:MAG: DUF5801 domain-containing protein, partial [Pseudomonadota bacterium]|nr:DUF5801 domain-containing protein [Pseudomonadota bacterium]